MTDPDELAGLGRGAGRRPAAVLDVHCDPEVPPIPPHATFEQAESTALAVLKGDVIERWGVMKQGLKTAIQEVIPHPGKPS